MLDPIPRRYTVCSHLFLPRCHRPSPNRDGSAARVCPTNYDFSWRAILEVADIPLCSGLQVCSPPRSFLPLRILLQGSRGFYVRAYRALLPPHAPDMLTVRIQVIDSTGTFTLSDSQPCRLLTVPPPALPGFISTMNLSASPGRPACPSRASGWSSLPTPWGLPCCVRFPCAHAVANTPAQRLGVPLRSIRPSRVSLPRYGSRVGLCIVLFEACSAFTRVTACTLALSPYIVTRYPKASATSSPP